MPIPDAILSKEAQLLFERTSGFEPIDGDLTRWRGYINIPSHHGSVVIEVEIKLPDQYPRRPPQVYILTPVEHPNVNNDGKVSMRILSRWRYGYRLYHVIVELKRLFTKVPPKIIEVAESWGDTQAQLNALITQKEQLSKIYAQKLKELETLKQKRNKILAAGTIQREKEKHVEDEILKIENELFAIEKQLDDWEISSREFAKKFINLKKRLYLLKKVRSTTSSNFS